MFSFEAGQFFDKSFSKSIRWSFSTYIWKSPSALVTKACDMIESSEIPKICKSQLPGADHSRPGFGADHFGGLPRHGGRRATHRSLCRGHPTPRQRRHGGGRGHRALRVAGGAGGEVWSAEGLRHRTDA